MFDTAVAAPIQSPDQLFIGGEWTKPSGSSKLNVLNSGTEELFLSVAEAQAEDVNKAVAAARKAFDEGPWPRMTHKERAEYIRAIGAEWAARAEDVARIWTTESGIIHSVASTRAPGLSGIYSYYADLADTYPFVEEHKPAVGNVGLLVREAVGVVAAIIPWNAPGPLIAYKTRPGTPRRCTIILKASPEAPGAAYVMAEICEKVGLPKGVINIMTADREVSELLVRHPGVDQSDLHWFHRRWAQDCGDLRRSHRALHTGAGRQVRWRCPR